MKLFTEQQYQASLARRIAQGYTQAGKPGVPMRVMLGRAEGARKRAQKQPERRVFPAFTHGMTTAQYVRLYYRDNGLDRASRIAPEAGTYPQSFLVLPDRPAPYYMGEPIEHEPEEALA